MKKLKVNEILWIGIQSWYPKSQNNFRYPFIITGVGRKYFKGKNRIQIKK